MNPLGSLNDHGQAVWLDYIERALLTGGGLGRLIAEDGLSGVTSNPTIFDKALAGGSDYDQAPLVLARRLDAVVAAVDRERRYDVQTWR